MTFAYRRVPARPLILAILPAVLASGIARAVDAPLTLAEVEHLALARQPEIAAQAAALSAAKQDADAAGALPDPMLMTSVVDLPINTEERFSGTRDDFTMYSVGIEQDFPAAKKRELQHQKAELMAVHAQHALDTASRTVVRDAKLAWLDRWQAERELSLAQEAEHAAESSRQLSDIAYRTGRAAQTDLLAAGAAVELAHDEAAQLTAMSQKAVPMLARWIGDADAQRPVPESFAAPDAPALGTLLATLHQHPDLAMARLDESVADNDVSAARADYRPDWSLGVEYGYRPLFADFISLNVKVGLPFFTAHRQDPRAAAAQARKDSAEQTAEDTKRRLEAEVRAAHVEWSQLRERLAHFDATVIPQASASAAAAERAYGTGGGNFMALLAARQASFAAQRMRIRLAADLARASAQLAYYTTGSHP